MISAFIPSFRWFQGNHGEHFTVFQIEVYSSGRCYKIERRYRAFHTLHKQLKHILNVPEFPRKQVCNLNLKFLEQRRRGLEHYIQELLKCKPVPKQLLNFLSLTGVSPESSLNSSNGEEMQEIIYQPDVMYNSNSYVDDDRTNMNDRVPVNAEICFKEEETDHLRFLCAWDEVASKVAISLEGSRKASDQNNKNRDYLLSMRDIYHMHEQFYLKDKSLANHFPKEIKPNYTPSEKEYEYISTCIEHYLSSAVQKVGKKLVVALLFSNEDPLICYEESWNDLESKKLYDLVDNAYKKLEEVLLLRETEEFVLQFATVYALEDQVFMNILDCLNKLYNFHLQPFLELKEIAHSQVKQAKDKLGQEIETNIRQQAKKDFEDWSEQLLITTKAIQQRYLEFYRKKHNLMLGGRDRMIQDEKRLEKTAFGLHGMPRLFKLEVQVCQEDLKLKNILKAIEECQRNKIKHQLTFLRDDYATVQEIEEEIASAQLKVFDAHLDVKGAEERLYKIQLALLNQEHKDILLTGISFDAAETLGDMPKELMKNTPEQNFKIEKLKKKLSNIYHKRAAIRSRKKNLEDVIEKNEAKKAAEKEKIVKAQKMKESKTKVLSDDQWAVARLKTLERLKEYKRKLLLTESKGPDIDEESIMTGSTLSPGSNTECQTITTSKGLSSKRINNKKSGVSEKPTAVKMAAEPLSPLLPSDDKSLTSVPPPPPPPPIGTNLQIKSLTEPTASKPVIPPSRINISQTAINEQLKLLKKPVIEVNQKTCPSNPFSLNEILATRSKLRTVSSDTEQRGKVQSRMDLSSVLKISLKNIRDITEYSDQESDSDSDFE